MSWIDQYNSTFFISLATLLVGAFGLSVKYCLRSKCEDLNLCFGLLKIHRNVQLEAEIEKRELELGIEENKNEL